VYRDFIYLDIDRIQSIIAQLQKGVLEQVLEGKSKEIEGKAGIAAGILSSFLPIQIETTINRKSDIYSSKVLHDYAYTIALEALLKEGLCFQIASEERLQLPKTNGIFVLVQGSASLLDYSLLKHLAENEDLLNTLTATPTANNTITTVQHKGRKSPQRTSPPPKEPSAIQKMWSFVEAIMGDSIQIRVRCSEDVVFSGTLERQFLREEARNFIFKYGGSPQIGWIMLAQMGQITEPLDKLHKFQQAAAKVQPQKTSFTTPSDAVNQVVEVLNALQESMASVSYPAIAVTPIAIYRELRGTK